jgi:hypothetical protein
VLSVLSDIAMACKQINNGKNNIRNHLRLNIVSCDPLHFDILPETIPHSHRQSRGISSPFPALP